MDSCDTHFVISSQKLKFEKKGLWGVKGLYMESCHANFVTTSPISKLQQTYMGGYRTIHEKLSFKFCNDLT